jgi:hexulose-6-phosphate isomerase
VIRTLFADRARDETMGEVCSRAAGHGFAGVGVAIGERGAVSFSSTESEVAAWRGEAIAHKVRLAALSLVPVEGVHFGAADVHARKRSIERTATALELARALGAEVLLVAPAVVGGAAESSCCSYSDRLNGTHAALLELRFDAERAGVGIALLAPANRFLLSPVELRELIDAQSSPLVGACLSVPGVSGVGAVGDWIRTLGHRIKAVQLDDPGDSGWRPGADDIAPWIGELRAVGFAGVLGFSQPDTGDAIGAMASA